MTIQYYDSCGIVDNSLPDVIQDSPDPKNAEGVNGDCLEVLPCDPLHCRLYGIYVGYDGVVIDGANQSLNRESFGMMKY